MTVSNLLEVLPKSLKIGIDFSLYQGYDSNTVPNYVLNKQVRYLSFNHHYYDIMIHVDHIPTLRKEITCVNTLKNK